tara:strand:+ start:860 stop:1081 length:222 start_codon:yes stop_codon:yes gene_type:complete
MKYINILLTIGVVVFINTSCATLNRAHGELNYNNHISKGQELQDLKKALDDGAINQDEDEDGQNPKASFNIEL